jgi:hypothetical protein
MQECDTRQRDRLSLFGRDKCVQAHWRELLFRINMQSTVTDGLLVCQCHRPLENTHPHSYHSHCLRRTNILFRPHPLYKCPEITGFQLQGCRRAAKRLSAGRFAYLSKLPSLSAAFSRIRSARVRLHPIIPLLRAELENNILIRLTHRNSHPRILTTAAGPHVMSSAPDLESGQGAQVTTLRVGAFFSLSYRCHLSQKC